MVDPEAVANAPRMRLTARERDMIQGVIDGKRNKDIAAQFGIAENTVKVYFSRLFAKVGVESRLGLAQWGRAYTEAQLRVQARYHELHPDQPESQPDLKVVEVAEFDVLKALLRTVDLNWPQRLEVLRMLE